MEFASECMLPKAASHPENHKDFVFFRNKKKSQTASLTFKFVGQKIYESNTVTEFNLCSEGSPSQKPNQIITRPRNCFIIMRSIFHSVIVRFLKNCELSSLQHVSAITSQLWGKNDGIFQLYFELLSQFEEHWHLNIYPEYRYHKVNKISRQLENKLVYQNMLDRMRYFTASSLLSKLEDIVILPAADAADTAVDATAAADAATAAEPFSSTYTYPSLQRMAWQSQGVPGTQRMPCKGVNGGVKRVAWRSHGVCGGKVTKQRIEKRTPRRSRRMSGMQRIEQRMPRQGFFGADTIQPMPWQAMSQPMYATSRGPWMNVEDLFANFEGFISSFLYVSSYCFQTCG
ncbi:HMRa2_A (YCR096C) [Zygosaccharomyces parabailii]|nr:HMRa2_A (YCR096C) [Zygosaccharomyces parabailii]